MNKRNTIQRALVLEAVGNLKCHATADEVYAAVAERYGNISRATVYRNLNLLAQSGEIRKVEVPGGAERFDHQCFDHYHARCLKCGKVFDVDMAYMTDLAATIGNTHGFAFSGHDIMFKGFCLECNEAK